MISLKDMLVWDNHGCMPLRPDDSSFLPQLQRYAQAGVDIASLNIGYDGVSSENAVPVAQNFTRWIDSHADQYLVVKTVKDVERARQSGRLGIVFDLEGGSTLAGDLDRVALFYELGVRWMLIAYNRNNDLGGGCQDNDGGLSAFGRQVIREMEQAGMVVCCSHTGHRTAMEVLDYSRNPVIFSHSNPSGLTDHKRNIPDELIRGCAATGGVIGINGVGLFLGNNDVSASSVARHIDYVASLTGPEHVGLSLDYAFDMDELNTYVAEHQDIFPPEDGYVGGLKITAPEQVPDIAVELSKLGYSDEDLRLIMGENHLRVAKQVWK